ncbi:MAG: NAD(P)-binding protein [Candidatus Aerophobetes bacterium]|nr:NAD(P)-binding protein [Candidatus Aerophobetes bacterium]
MSSKKDKVGAVMVVGGGIGGIQASLDLAESGFKVYLVEKDLSIGGVMAQLDKTFPTNDCAMCILSPKLVDCGRHFNIEMLTGSEVQSIEGEEGNFKVRVKKHPRFVDLAKCTGCGDCAEVCPVEIPSEYEENLINRKAIYRPFTQANPSAFGIDKRGTPPCRAACPLHVNAQGYVALMAQGKFKEALELIREKNPLPGICGRVCTHPCEDECQRQRVDEPIAIMLLKRFAADYERGVDFELKIEKEKNKKIAIIGSGPAGLTAAYDLRKLGYKPIIFEALPVAGGMLSVGIPDYRLPKDILRKEIGILENFGIEIKLNTPIGENLTLKDLKNDGYEAIFIAVGAHISMKLQVPGEDLKGVHHGVEFLRRINSGKKVEIGEKVVVIGGGNAAIDAARTVYRLGAEQVTIVYRRSRVEMPANEEEIKEAEKEGIEILYLATPTRILGKDGKVNQVQCLRMKLGEPDASGRRRPIPVEGSEFIIDTDTIIPAIGQSSDLSFLGSHHKFNLVRGRRFEVDPLTLETNIKGIFAGGDAVTGPNTVIEAMAAGRKAAISIDRYLQGEDMRINREGEGTQKSELEVDIEGVEPEKRIEVPTLSLNERKENFKEVVLGFSEEEAINEAKRCLACGGCSECMQCVEACKAEAVLHDMVEEDVEVNVGSVVLFPGFDEFNPQLKEEYGYKRFPNVISSIEFERILSASGPYQGHVRRISDDKHPEKIAWIQCVGSRDSKIGRGYCSSVCCMYSTKEALVTKEHAPDTETTIFYIDMRAYGKDFDKYIERAKSEYGVRYVRSRISEVQENSKTHNLRIKYEAEDGKLMSEEFELVVLSVGLEASKSAKELAEKFGIELNRYNFARTNNFEPLQTSRPGIFVGGAFSGPKDIPETVAQASGVAAEASSILSEARDSLIKEKEYPPEIDVRGEAPRIGVFVCHCGINIGGVVDVPSVVEYAKSLPGVVYAEDNLYTCSQDTQERMKEAIKEHKLNRVVVASCTPRTHEPLFQETIREAGLNRYLFEMANIRDQCSWVHMREPEKATEKAKDLVKMAVAKAQLIEPLERANLPVTHKGLLIGGGVSGMVSALRLAEEEYEVYLVEKEKELGGQVRYIYYTLEGEDVQKFLRELIDKVKSNDKIHIFTKAQIEKIEGFVGNFKTVVKVDSSLKELEHGIIIVATGAEEYTPTEYLYGEEKRVITQRELEKLIFSGKLDVNSQNSIVMIQCVGSRNDKHPYCSRVCCSEAIKNALKIKEMNKKANVYILYRDIRTYGFKEDYYQKAREEGVVFIRYEEGKEPKVRKNKGKIEVLAEDLILKENLLINADLVVLSTGMVPREDNKELSQILKVPLNEDDFFLEAHVKLRPVDFATDGIFLCGLAHSPKFIEESISQANAAVSRACTILSREQLETEGIVSGVDEVKCVGCGLCKEVCPYGAIDIKLKKVLGKEKEVAEVNVALCKGCGACAASCRSGAINLKGFSDEEIFEQIGALV